MCYKGKLVVLTRLDVCGTATLPELVVTLPVDDPLVLSDRGAAGPIPV